MYAKLPAKSKPSKSVSKDQTRPILTHAELREVDGAWELVCCDSYQLARIPLDVYDAKLEPALTPGPISTEALKAIEKAGYFQANGTIEPVSMNGTPLGATSYQRPSDVGQFPNWDQLTPEAPNDGDAFTITLNVSLLAALAAALGTKQNVTLRVDLSKNTAGYQLKPITVASDARPGVFDGLLMPVRPPGK